MVHGITGKNDSYCHDTALVKMAQKQSARVKVPLFFLTFSTHQAFFGLSDPDSTYKMTHSNVMFWHYCVKAVVLSCSSHTERYCHKFLFCDESNPTCIN